MSGVSRFLTKRDKSHKHHLHTPHLSGHHEESKLSATSGDKPIETFDVKSPSDFYGLFIDTRRPSVKDEEIKLKTIKQRLLDSKGVMVKDGHVRWALRSNFSSGDVIAAYNLLVAMSDASEGLLTPYDPATKLSGAVNRNAVTCFLDSTLFAMFSHLDSFEAMLYNSFDDVVKERLAFLLRLWVNLLRSGYLITTDITKQIQENLAECGWEAAREVQQQDASEAFTFITEKLNLPLLTLKMDIYHTGRQDTDDHKFINERLLEVAIPTLENGEHPKEIRLEDCLEEYFNNRIEVKRYLERRNTLQSTKSQDSKAKEMGLSIHVEAIELDPEASSPLTPLPSTPSYISDRPSIRNRASSIIQERYVPDPGGMNGSPLDNPRSPLSRLRGGSIRKEVLMPAWQFFSLIPWYTDKQTISNDAQVAAHFSSKRPVLGLCLKRYSYTNSGQAVRLQTEIDIPIEIGLPHFIQEDSVGNDGPLYGNFKLSLQSVVCHRGYSVDSGHYISLVRRIIPAKGSEQEEMSDWIRLDDLASPRVSLVDIQKALKKETPYLLFYQIQPVEGDPGNVTSGEQPAPAYKAESDKSGASMADDTLVAVSSVEHQPEATRPNTAQTSTDGDTGRTPEFDARRRLSAISFSEHLPHSEHKSLDLTREKFPELEQRKSISLNNSLNKTFSILGMRSKKGSKEDFSTEIISSTGDGPQIHVERVGMEKDQPVAIMNASRNSSDPDLTRSPAPTTSPGSGASVLGRSRSKRDKSRSRKLKSSRGKLEDSDRECIVM